ncbi:MAG: hypothetical protein ACN4GZ_19030, partial [Acidimicrobiales bacterium]
FGVDPNRQFTITGGMTFAGGPFNSYCLHALAQAWEELCAEPGSAFLTGIGGWFTKHSFFVVGTTPPSNRFRYERPQERIDAEPIRPLMEGAPETATVDAYTVCYDRDGSPAKAILAVSDMAGARAWATSTDRDTMSALIESDHVTSEVSVWGDVPVLTASL